MPSNLYNIRIDASNVAGASSEEAIQNLAKAALGQVILDTVIDITVKSSNGAHRVGFTNA